MGVSVVHECQLGVKLVGKYVKEKSKLGAMPWPYM